MSDLPPGFILDKPQAQPPGLPPGFVLDKPDTGRMTAAGAGFKQGLGDILYGGAQIGARMGPEEGGAAFADPAELQKRQQVVDQATRQREQAYGAAPAVAQHPIVSGLGRMGGNIAATAPLMAIPGVGGAMVAPATIPGRLATATGIGAGVNLMQPAPIAPGQNLGPEKLKQGVVGGITGAAGGALGEALSSTLGNAIAGNNTAAIDRYLTGGFRQTVKPGRLAGPTGRPQLNMQDNRILTAIDTINTNRQNIQLTNDAGDLLPRGTLPTNLRQFGEALDETKRIVFQAYDHMAENTGSAGVRVGVLPAAQMLRNIAANPTNRAVDEALVRDAERLATNFERQLFFSPSELQDVISKLNRRVTRDLRSQGSSELLPVVQNLRQSLDGTITSLEGPGYQQLKNQYGAIRSIERDVANAAQREENKPPWGSRLANWSAIAELGTGMLTGHTSEGMAAALATEAGKYAIRYLNNPNRAIRRLFEQRANPPGAVRQAIGAGMSYAPAVGGVLGGQGGTAAIRQDASRDLRPPAF